MRSAAYGVMEELYAALADDEAGRADIQLLYRIAEAFQLSSASLHLMPSNTDKSIADRILESSLPEEFWKRMDEVCPPSVCPMFNVVRNSLTPVMWCAEEIRRQSELVNAPMPAFLALYREYGLSSGIVFPISAIDGVRHAIRYDGNRSQPSQSEINDLAMLSAHFFQAYDRQRHPQGDRGGLSERELEVVRWSAAGNTSGEIARMMALSDHTVNAYINSAMKKLDCTSRTQLVAKALRMRIIS